MSTYYVSKSGNDSNNGTSWVLAKLTIAGANALAVAGDTINLGAGTWTETGTLGKISNVTYNGINKYVTIYNGYLGWITSTTENHIYKITNIKINWTDGMANSNGYCVTGGYMQMTDVIHDFAGMTANSVSAWHSVPANQTSIFYKTVFANYKSFSNFLTVPNGTNCTIKFYNCTFYRSHSTDTPSDGNPKIAYTYSASGAKIYFKNNILYAVTDGDYRNDPVIYNNIGSPTVYKGNNCFYNVYHQSEIVPLFDPTDFAANPLFVNAPGGDFRLQDSSPCIGKGTANLP